MEATAKGGGLAVEPVRIKNVMRAGSRQLFESRPRPVPVVEDHAGHGQRKPAPVVERLKRVAFFQRDRGIQILPV